MWSRQTRVRVVLTNAERKEIKKTCNRSSSVEANESKCSVMLPNVFCRLCCWREKYILVISITSNNVRLKLLQLIAKFPLGKWTPKCLIMCRYFSASFVFYSIQNFMSQFVKCVTKDFFVVKDFQTLVTLSVEIALLIDDLNSKSSTFVLRNFNISSN